MACSTCFQQNNFQKVLQSTAVWHWIYFFISVSILWWLSYTCFNHIVCTVFAVKAVRNNQHTPHWTPHDSQGPFSVFCYLIQLHCVTPPESFSCLTDRSRCIRDCIVKPLLCHVQYCGLCWNKSRLHLLVLACLIQENCSAALLKVYLKFR